MNNKSKIRRSTISVVLGKGKGKVISYKDIMEARVTYTAKDIIKSKGKHGRKRKNIMLKADIEVEPEVVYTAEKVITGKKKCGRKRKRAIQEVDKPELELELELEQEVAQTIEEPEQEVA
jgi:hypothetical protein